MTQSPGELLQNLRFERFHSGRLVDGLPATQAQIARLADLEPRALRNLENGTSTPKIKTLEGLIDALDLYYPLTNQEKRALWSGYGMKLDFISQPIDLPEAEVIQKAVQAWRNIPVVQNNLAAAPAILSDIGHRILDFNPVLAKLSDKRSDTARLTGLRGKTLYDLIFSAAPKIAGKDLFANAQDYFPLVVYNWKAELWPYRRESWYWPGVNQARTQYPEFKKWWDSLPDAPPQFHPANRAIPLMLRTPLANRLLTFNILQFPLTADPRLRVIHLAPADETTTLQCQLWARESEASEPL